MKLLSLFSFFNGIFGLSLNSTYMQNYNEYIEKYNKSFSNDNFIVFKNNSMLVDTVNNQNKSYTLELNMFSDNYPQISINVNKNLRISDDSSVSIQTDGLFGKKFLLIEVGGNDVYLKNGEKFSYAEDSIVIEELLGKIILIGEKNKGL